MAQKLTPEADLEAYFKQQIQELQPALVRLGSTNMIIQNETENAGPNETQRIKIIVSTPQFQITSEGEGDSLYSACASAKYQLQRRIDIVSAFVLEDSPQLETHYLH